MTARTFGRKTAVAAAFAQPDAPVLSDAEAEMAARRAAFIAEERKRSGRAPDPIDEPEPAPSGFGARGRAGHAPAPRAPAPQAAAPRIVMPALPEREPHPDDRKPAMAYTLWLMMGIIGGHRHYLGLHASAFAQAGLFVTAIATLLVVDKLALLAGAMGLLWLLADLAMMPFLCRAANLRADARRA